MEINLGMLIGPEDFLIAVIEFVSMWRVFQKAGEHGWACIVPLYNIYVYYKIIWGSGWMLFLMLVPIYNIIFSIQSIFRMAKVFGKGVGFGFGLWFLNPFFMIILAFGQAEYQEA